MGRESVVLLLYTSRSPLEIGPRVTGESNEKPVQSRDDRRNVE